MKPFAKLPGFIKNYYFLFGLFFIIWMFFIDSNDFGRQIGLTKKYNNLKAQKEFYLEKKVEVVKNKAELTTNIELLEKFARENYLMKRPSEDLFVVVKK